MRSRFIAKIAMRVRVSELKGTVAVSGNGSAFIVGDSKAIARVDVAWLNNMGGLLVAPWRVPTSPHTPIKRTTWAEAEMSLRQLLGVKRGRLFVIKMSSPSQDHLLKVQNVRVRSLYWRGTRQPRLKLNIPC